VVDFPAAVRLITAGPAEAIGLADRGRLEPGCTADLVLVVPDGRWPRVVRVLASSAADLDGWSGATPARLTRPASPRPAAAMR
jgi:cytosine/adenosine deaminase-related metal-dependent hydrolase